jgi:hypothetical protein
MYAVGKDGLLKMSTFKIKNKFMASMIILLLFASTMLALVSMANAIVPSSVKLYDKTGALLDFGIGDRVHVGDIVTVKGEVDNPGYTVIVYWDSVSGKELARKTLTGSATAFEIDVEIPVAPAGNYAIIVLETAFSDGSSPVGSAPADIAVDSQILLDPPQAARGDTVIITGTGFTNDNTGNRNRITATLTGNGENEEIVKSAADVRTFDDGTFMAEFIVPSVPDYNYYVITAKDGAGNICTEDFAVGARLTLTPDEGPAGTLIKIEGRGFTDGHTIKEVRLVDLGGSSADVVITLDSAITVNSVGKFTIDITDKVVAQNFVDKMGVVVQEVEAGGKSATGTFMLTGKCGVTANPLFATPTVGITITGENFAKIQNNVVNIEILSAAGITYALIGGIVVDSGTGTFKVDNVIAPAGVPFGVYTLTATDSFGISANTIFGYASPTASTSHTDVQAGQTIKLNGYGFDLFTGSTIWSTAGYTMPVANVTIDGVNVVTGMSVALLNAGVDFVVPTTTTGIHTVEIISNVKGLLASTTINVIETTSLEVTPPTAIKDLFVNITGTYFKPGAAVELFIHDATDNKQLQKLITFVDGTLVTNTNGRFSVIYAIPSSFAFGEYYLNATQNDNLLNAQAGLTVLPLDIAVNTDSLKYAQNSMANFKLSGLAPASGTIEIYTPEDNLFGTLNIKIGNWELNSKTGLFDYTIGTFAADGNTIFMLSTGADIGIYKWVATFSDAGTPIVIEGTFEVVDKDANGGTGTPGEQGPAGPQGSTGATGPQGDAGATGAQGSAGAVGPKGDAGAVGPKGDAGAVGPKGDAGAAGTAGSSSLLTKLAVVLGFVSLIVVIGLAFFTITLSRRLSP